jgi:hypothetical protein
MVCTYNITLTRKMGCNFDVTVTGSPRDAFRVDGCSKSGCDSSGYCGSDCIEHGYGAGIQIIRNQKGEEVEYGSCCDDPNQVSAIDSSCVPKEPPLDGYKEVNAIKVCYMDNCKGGPENPIPIGETWFKAGTGPNACCDSGDQSCDLCSKFPVGKDTTVTLFAANYIERPLVGDKGTELGIFRDVTLKTCKLYCNVYPDCRSFTYGILPGGKKECHLKEKVVKASDVKDFSLAAKVFKTYFQQSPTIAKATSFPPCPCKPKAGVAAGGKGKGRDSHGSDRGCRDAASRGAGAEAAAENKDLPLTMRSPCAPSLQQ